MKKEQILSWLDTIDDGVLKDTVKSYINTSYDAGFQEGLKAGIDQMATIQCKLNESLLGAMNRAKFIEMESEKFQEAGQ